MELRLNLGCNQKKKNKLNFNATLLQFQPQLQHPQFQPSHLHLRGDPNAPVIAPTNVERDDTHVVSRHEERVVTLVVDEKRKHAPQLVEAILPLLQV